MGAGHVGANGLVQYTTMQCSTPQHSAVHLNAVWYTTVRRNTTQPLVQPLE